MNPINLPARQIPVPSTLSPEAQAIVGATTPPLPEPHPPLHDKQAWRTYVAEREAQAQAMITSMMSTDLVAEDRDVHGVPVYVFDPPGADRSRTRFEIHGGALITLAGDACRLMAAAVATRSGMHTWGVDYRMPPDHPYPTPLDDCLAAYRGLLELQDPERIVVSGGSAGGNLAAALMLRARDEGLPLPAAVVLSTPEVDLTESGDSFTTNLGVDNILGLLRPVNELYADGHDLRHPYLSPLFADHTGFPPTILTTGTRDLFLSNTVLMHRALRRAGVEAELHVLEAGSHAGFFGLAPEDRELQADVQRFIDRHCPPS